MQTRAISSNEGSSDVCGLFAEDAKIRASCDAAATTAANISLAEISWMRGGFHLYSRSP
jgi:hypothetical protein